MTIVWTVGKNTMSVIPDDTLDMDTTDKMAGGMLLKSIQFYPSAANDVLVVRDGSDSGAEMMHVKDVVGGGLVKYFDTYCKPYIKDADCTWGTAANVRIIFEYA